jgi:hypothetical protein
LTKTQADGVLQSGVQTLVGHGIEVSFDVGGEPTWEHGEICDVAADKIRVRYYSDNTRHWHRRFMMEHHDKKKSPLLVQAAACAPPPGGRDGAWPVPLAAAGREGVDAEFLLSTAS